MTKSTVLMILALSLLVSLDTLPQADAAESKPTPTAGKTRVISRVADFVLPNAHGKQIALSDVNDGRFCVVVFMGTECPIGNAYIPTLQKLRTQYADRGVHFVGINANLAD